MLKCNWKWSSNPCFSLTPTVGTGSHTYMCAHMCTSFHNMWLVQSASPRASQETRYFSSFFARKNSRHKTPSTESPTSTKHCSFISSGPPLVSTFVDLCFVSTLLKRVVKSTVNALAGHVSEPQDEVSDWTFAEKQSFSCRGWLASGCPQQTALLLITITICKYGGPLINTHFWPPSYVMTSWWKRVY